MARTSLGGVVFLLLGPALVSACCDDVRIGAFNIKTFGQAKVSDSTVLAYLAQIVQRYDILLIQEIRDISETAIEVLLNEVNKQNGSNYNHTMSERLGRTSYKEQYSYFYRLDCVELLDTYQYNDPNDVFAREPYSAKFRLLTCAIPPCLLEPVIVLVGVHIDPDVAVEEMEGLMDVHAAVEQYWSCSNIVIMGDLNADCSYASGTALAGLSLRTDPRFTWCIPDCSDTTTSSTDCAYDRVIVSGPLRSCLPPCQPPTFCPSCCNVFRYDDEYGLDATMRDAVSDHYPVEFLIMSSITTTTTTTTTTTSTSTTTATPTSVDLRVGAFNAATFGSTKVSKDHVLDVLKQMVQRYDILLIEEIRNKPGTALKTLIDAVNEDIGIPGRYANASSARLGRTSAKEQYAYLYRTDRVQLMETYQYNDAPDDPFNREPYCAKFRHIASGHELVLCGIRTQPSDTVAEMEALMNVHSAVQQHWNTDNILIMGDLNADCSYASGTALAGLSLRTDSRFTWLIGDDVDTYTKSNDCAYDRLIVSGAELTASAHGAGVFRFDTEYNLNQAETEEVSDRYPVEVLILITY